MKIIYTTLFCTLILFTQCNTNQSITAVDSINPIIGNASYAALFNEQPTAVSDEQVRIKTHLKYVESLLRKADVSHLSDELMVKRNHLLKLLNSYWNNGIFPKNYDKENRAPCFIDRDGNICAVGYLVEQTAGRGEAERINALFQYKTIHEMKDKGLLQWVAKSGLNLDEVATIQPTYGPIYSDDIKPTQAAVSAGITGINIGFSILNMSDVKLGKISRVRPSASITLGFLQTGLGVWQMSEYSSSGSFSAQYTNMQKIALTNIAVGCASSVVGLYALNQNKKSKDNSVSWDAYSVPNAQGGLTMGLSVKKTF